MFMRRFRFALAPAALALLAGVALAAEPPGAAPKVGDHLAPYTPTRSIGAHGNQKCETC
jgi:hypothetical protein